MCNDVAISREGRSGLSWSEGKGVATLKFVGTSQGGCSGNPWTCSRKQAKQGRLERASRTDLNLRQWAQE